MDYENFLKFKSLNLNTNNYNNQQYSVFIDSGDTGHPDFEILNIKPFAKKNIYFKELNEFFDLYESLVNHKIIIASHPRTEYHNKNIFGGRTIVQGKTLELISNCKNVVSLMSTAITYAVLFKKPIN